MSGRPRRRLVPYRNRSTHTLSPPLPSARAERTEASAGEQQERPVRCRTRDEGLGGEESHAMQSPVEARALAPVQANHRAGLNPSRLSPCPRGLSRTPPPGAPHRFNPLTQTST